jgi:hypothetical protein
MWSCPPGACRQNIWCRESWTWRLDNRVVARSWHGYPLSSDFSECLSTNVARLVSGYAFPTAYCSVDVEWVDLDA